MPPPGLKPADKPRRVRACGREEFGIILGRNSLLPQNTSRGTDCSSSQAPYHSLRPRGSKLIHFAAPPLQNGSATSILRRTFRRNVQAVPLAVLRRIPANKDAECGVAGASQRGEAGASQRGALAPGMGPSRPEWVAERNPPQIGAQRSGSDLTILRCAAPGPRCRGPWRRPG